MFLQALKCTILTYFQHLNVQIHTYIQHVNMQNWRIEGIYKLIFMNIEIAGFI